MSEPNEVALLSPLAVMDDGGETELDRQVAEALRALAAEVERLRAERDALREALHGLFAQSTPDAVHPEDEDDYEAAMALARDQLCRSRTVYPEPDAGGSVSDE